MSDLQCVLALLLGRFVVYIGMVLVGGWLYNRFKEA